jgi:guanylate kinase
MKIIVLTAPSGSGKTTIARRVMEVMPEIQFSVSATTRQPRAYERHGVDYFFMQDDEFRRLVEEDEFIEHEEVYPGRYYGTLRAEVDRVARSAPVMLDIDVKGAMNVKRFFGDRALTIFVKPPSLAVLAERLQKRGTETEQTVAARLERARMELGYAGECDAIVLNEDLETAVDETLRLVRRFVES